MAGLAVATAFSITPASAAQTGDACGESSYGVYGCMYIGGGEIRGWAQEVVPAQLPVSEVHEEVTGPSGVICNSSQVTLTTTSQVVSCQVNPGEGPYQPGTYCAYTWAYFGNGYYQQDSKNCLKIT
jgi:hypothetical protein